MYMKYPLHKPPSFGFDSCRTVFGDVVRRHDGCVICPIDRGVSGCLRNGRCYHLNCTCYQNNICPTIDAKSKKTPTKCRSKALPAAPSNRAEDMVMISVRPSHIDWPHSLPDTTSSSFNSLEMKNTNCRTGKRLELEKSRTEATHSCPNSKGVVLV